LPTRASTAPATRNEAYSAVVRTKISEPMRAIGRIRASEGRREVAGARSRAATKATPMPSCATTVAHAEPASPQSKP
jgi:hypothetical protein